MLVLGQILPTKSLGLFCLHQHSFIVNSRHHCTIKPLQQYNQKLCKHVLKFSLRYMSLWWSCFPSLGWSRRQSTWWRKLSKKVCLPRRWWLVSESWCWTARQGLSWWGGRPLHMVCHVVEPKTRKNQSLVTLHHLKIGQIPCFSGFVQCDQASLSKNPMLYNILCKWLWETYIFHHVASLGFSKLVSYRYLFYRRVANASTNALRLFIFQEIQTILVLHFSPKQIDRRDRRLTEMENDS